MILNLIRRIVHILLPTRRPLYRFLKSISPDYKNLDILEIGSGDTSINQSAEHIFDINSAIQNLSYLLKDRGHLVVSVPFIYPLHDESKDYWRFTEHALKKLFSDFKILTIKRTGIRQFPTQYIFLFQKH